MKEIAIISGKGGTGKTSITAAFSKYEKSIIVVDADVDASNQHILLQPKNIFEEVFIAGEQAQIDYDSCTSCAICIDYCRFDAIKQIDEKVIIEASACEGCRLCTRVCPTQSISMIEDRDSRWYKGKIDNGILFHARLSPGQDNSGKLVSVLRGEAKLLSKKEKTEIVLIDGSPGIGCPVISTITGVRKAVIVTEPTQSGLHDLSRAVDLCKGFHLEPQIIVNKYNINTQMSEDINNWCKENNIELIGKIPYDQLFSDALHHRQTIPEFAPNSSLDLLLREIWAEIKE